jgi:hypothetical protein
MAAQCLCGEPEEGGGIRVRGRHAVWTRLATSSAGVANWRAAAHSHGGGCKGSGSIVVASNKATVEGNKLLADVDGDGVESKVAAGIAESTDREESGMGESGNNVDVAGRQRKTGQIELCLESGMNNSAIGVADADGQSGKVLVDNMSGNSAELGCAAAVSNSNGVGR